MAYQAVQTFDVDVTLLKSYLPQINMGGTLDVYTSARTTTAISHAASRVNAAYIAGGADIDAIAADTASVAYAQAQRLVCLLTVTQVMFGISGLGIGVEDALRDMREEARNTLAQLSIRPEEIGVGSENLSPEVSSNIPNTPSTDNSAITSGRKWQSSPNKPVRW